MREIYVRGISGVLYSTFILVGLFNNQITFSIVLVIFSILALIEFQRLINYKSYFAIALLLLLVYNFYKSHIDHSYLNYLLMANFTCHFFYCINYLKIKKSNLNILLKVF